MAGGLMACRIGRPSGGAPPRRNHTDAASQPGRPIPACDGRGSTRVDGNRLARRLTGILGDTEIAVPLLRIDPGGSTALGLAAGHLHQEDPATPQSGVQGNPGAEATPRIILTERPFS